MGVRDLVGLGVTVHLILFICIFDIYFTSPITRGVPPIANTLPPFCKRLVVLSVDGLRFDALLENDTHGHPVAPYIRWSMAHRGSWAISRTHLPTESRPGHVAMLAGFYEDPSAVTKGWKQNPVDFDSIFNQSRCSYAWGSPDIVEIFYKDMKHKCSHRFTYDESQDFSGDTQALDNWVLDRVQGFFGDSNNLKDNNGTIYFLHLLGQDTSGHTHKPGTDRYRSNLRNVDRIVKEVDKLFARIYPDNSTAFVLTADHGMTDWGSHGAGDPSETLTPLVAWGRGIRQNKNSNFEVEQADITPLLAVLLGVSIPVNSVGIIPTQFLNASQAIASQAMLLNTQQISAQYLAKRSQIEERLSLLKYKQFSTLDSNQASLRIKAIRDAINSGDFQGANEKSRHLMAVSLEGLDFYHRYFQVPLFTVTILSYLLWVIYLLINLGRKAERKFGLTRLTLVAILPCFVVYHEGLPYTFYLYFLLPTFLAKKVYEAVILPKSINLKGIFACLSVLLGAQLFVLGFFHRWVWSIVLLLISIWPFLHKIQVHPSVLHIWICSSIALSFFTFIPVVGRQPQPFLNFLGSLTAVACNTFMTFVFHKKKVELRFDLSRSFLILLSGCTSFFVHYHFEQKGLSATGQITSWALLIFSTILSSVYQVDVLRNLASFLAILSVPFTLLSIGHEMFFLLALFAQVFSWAVLEMANSNITTSSIKYQHLVRPRLHEEPLSITDVRRAYFFLAYIFLSFFGLGNLATLNSFDPAWVRCFVTSFSPSLMSALILLKVIIPFFAVSLSLRTITLVLNVAAYKIFVLVLVFSNIMAMTFLFLVRTEGSWLDIGTSLSHYVIQQATIVFLLLLHLLAQLVVDRWVSASVQQPPNMKDFWQKQKEKIWNFLNRLIFYPD